MSTPRNGPAAFAGFLLLDVVLPLALYYGLRALGVSVWTALLLGAAVPVVRLVTSLALGRGASRASLFTLVLLTVGTLIGLLTADPRLLMARESWLTAVVGGWILLTLAWRRPLVFTATVGFMPEEAARDWERSWETSAVFRRVLRAMTGGFGLAFLIDATARVVMSYTLPLDWVPGVSTALLVVMLVAVVQVGKAVGRRHAPDPAATGR